MNFVESEKESSLSIPSRNPLVVAGSFPIMMAPAVVYAVPSWRCPGPLHVLVRPLTAEAVPHSAPSQRRVQAV